MKIFYTLFLIPTIVTAQLNYFNALRFKENLHLYESNIIKPNYDQLNLNENINEKLLYTFLDTVEQENKYLVITSKKPIVNND